MQKEIAGQEQKVRQPDDRRKDQPQWKEEQLWNAQIENVQIVQSVRNPETEIQDMQAEPDIEDGDEKIIYLLKFSL